MLLQSQTSTGCGAWRNSSTS